MQKPISRQELYESLVGLQLLPLADGRALRVLVVDDDPKAVELVATLIHALRARKKRYGLAAICIGGGEATAVVVEAL